MNIFPLTLSIPVSSGTGLFSSVFFGSFKVATDFRFLEESNLLGFVLGGLFSIRVLRPCLRFSRPAELDEFAELGRRVDLNVY